MSPIRAGRASWATPLTGHTAEVNAVAFAPDGPTLAAASNDRTVQLWELVGLDATSSRPDGARLLPQRGRP
jgi:WD40 repeat protein